MDNKHRFILWTVVVVAAVTLLPFLGLTDFATKGEPREAVVAVSMLNEGNWILPVSNGADTPAHPPLLQWCIALASLPAGHVSEFTARLPSALALIVMLAMGAVFFAKRKNSDLSFLSAMVVLTAFDVHRAATNCRVDMLLTMFVVCALYAFYRWWEGKGDESLSPDSNEGEGGVRGAGWPWWAVLCMTGGALTKGAVGIVLPAVVMLVFIVGEAWRSGFAVSWKGAVAKLCISALMACVVPMLWYAAACHMGGGKPLGIVPVENLDDVLGIVKSITNDNSWLYSAVMLVAGWLPWTVPVVLTLFVLPWRSFGRSISAFFRGKTAGGVLGAIAAGVKKAEPVQAFTWTAFLLTFLYCCLPSGRHSAALLVCYPFLAVLVTEYAVWLMKRSSLPIRLYIGFLTVAGFVLTAVLVAVRAGAVPDTIFTGSHAYQYVRILHALAFSSLTVGDILLIVLPLVAACLGLIVLFHRRVGFIADRPVLTSTFMTVLFFMSLGGYYRPAAMVGKSLRPFAETVAAVANDQPLYSFTGVGSPARFYGVDFYLGDRIRQFDLDRPRQGVVMVNAANLTAFRDTYSKDYDFQEAYRSANRQTELGDTIIIYRFSRR